MSRHETRRENFLRVPIVRPRGLSSRENRVGVIPALASHDVHFTHWLKLDGFSFNRHGLFGLTEYSTGDWVGLYWGRELIDVGLMFELKRGFVGEGASEIRDRVGEISFGPVQFSTRVTCTVSLRRQIYPCSLLFILLYRAPSDKTVSIVG